MKKIGACKFIVLLLFLQTASIVYINQFNYIDKSSNIQKEESRLINLKAADQLEYNKINGTLSDITQLEIQLPDYTWNITSIQLNFSNIKLHRHIRIINDTISGSGFKNLAYDDSKSPKEWCVGLGIQFNCTEPTTIYGVYLYGKQTLNPNEFIFIEIREYDDYDHTVSNTKLIVENLNISHKLDWYYQDFSDIPVELGIDEYYLFLDGYMMANESANFSFGYYPGSSNLHRSEWVWKYEWKFFHYVWVFYETIYSDGPLLCKLVEKINRTYYPENLEMKAEINGIYYNICNTTICGGGNLTLENINFYPNNDKILISITDNNESVELIYNLTYSVSLQKQMSIPLNGEDGGNGGNDKITKITTGLPFEILYLFILIIIISIIASLASYQALRRNKAKKEVFREKIFNKYMDVLNLGYIIVSDKRSGLCIYDQIITDKKFDPSLVSGFLQAISSFGIELTGSEEQSQTIKLEYQKSKILMSEFKNYRIINIFEENPSKDFKFALDLLSQDIDKYFGRLLENFDGELTHFTGIKELLERHLQISLVYPLKIVMHKEVKLNKNEKSVINQASNIMKKANLDHFYVSYLMKEREFNPKRAELILNLINKKIFQPII